MHTQERVRGWCCGNTDCHGEGETPIRITCRNSVKNAVFQLCYCGFQYQRSLDTEILFERVVTLVSASLIRLEGRYVSVQVVLLLTVRISTFGLGVPLTKEELMKKSWNIVVGTSQGVDWHFVNQKFTNPLTSLYFYAIRSRFRNSLAVRHSPLKRKTSVQFRVSLIMQ